MSNWKKRLEAGALALAMLALAAAAYWPQAGSGADRQVLGAAKIPAGPYVASPQLPKGVQHILLGLGHMRTGFCHFPS